MPELDRIIDLGEYLLDQTSDPVIKLRLLRDVLCKPLDYREVIEANKDLDRHSHIRTLAGEQWEDGSWGRLHSKDYSLKQNIGTTEVGVERAVNLGLVEQYPILEKASRYLVFVIETGEVRDRPEKNDRWETGVRLFAASSLARIDPLHPCLDEVWALWYEIATRTFESGQYDEEAEVRAHKVLTGASVRDSYLTLRNKYTLYLISSRPSDLNPPLEEALLTYLWHLDRGLGYQEVNVSRPPVMKPGPLDRWFTSHELLTRFPTWQKIAGEVVEWLWKASNAEGYWDFGPKSPSSVFMPLSENWRKKGARQLDWSTRVLLLLSKYYRTQIPDS
ncbi:MAG: hypothetical protein PVF83_10190 [Anaerolineales bacterium]